MFSFVLPSQCECGRPVSARVENSLEVHSPNLQKGRALFFRAGRELTREGHDSSELGIPADPTEIAAATQQRDQQEFLAQLRKEVVRQSDERDALRDEIRTLRSQRDAELTRNTSLVERSVAATVSILETQNTKLQAAFLEFWELLEKAGGARRRAYESLDEESKTMLAMRGRLDEVAKRDFWGEFLKMAEEAIPGLMNSPLADALSLQFALALHERSARKNGGAFNRDEALASAMMQGKRFRGALQQLRTWSTVDNHPARKSASLAADFLLGGIELKDLDKFLTSLQTTVSRA